MRILITGATGLLGRVLVEDLAEYHEVTALVHDRRLSNVSVAQSVADLRNTQQISMVWDELAPELVIHTAALATLEDCQRDPVLARQLNAEVVADVAMLCSKHMSRLVHISTDAVFGDSPGPHPEDEPVAPKSVYARTKLAGEQAALAASPSALVARVNFFGWSQSGTRSIAEFFYNALSRGDRVRGYTDVEFASLYNRDLADVLVEASMAGVQGIRHIVSSDSMSKFEFGRMVATTFGFDPDLIEPSSVAASDNGALRRPSMLTLSSELLGSDLGRRLPTMQEGLQRMHRDLESGYVQRLRSRSVRPS